MPSSQGPAREETPPLRDRVEQKIIIARILQDYNGDNLLRNAVKLFDAGAKSVVAAPQLEKYDLELNQERLVSAVMCGLEEMNRRGCQELAAVQWFQAGYREAMEHLRTADEEEVFKVREGKPTLTGKNATRLAGAAALPSGPDSGIELKRQLQVAHNILRTELGRACSLSASMCEVCTEVEKLQSVSLKMKISPCPECRHYHGSGRCSYIVAKRPTRLCNCEYTSATGKESAGLEQKKAELSPKLGDGFTAPSLSNEPVAASPPVPSKEPK